MLVCKPIKNIAWTSRVYTIYRIVYLNVWEGKMERVYREAASRLLGAPIVGW